MALLTSELQRIKIELGFNALTLSALPYAFDGITQIFEQVVQPYLQGGAITSSSTTVAAVATGATAVPVSLTLASVTGFSVGDRVVVDLDAAQETPHVLSITGSAISVALSSAHSGTYPVTVEGGESIVRGYLKRCIDIHNQISGSFAFAGLKKADEVEFFPSGETSRGPIDDLRELQRYWRNELASAIGVPNLREQRIGSGQMLESY